jgi:hypothetical protein
MQLNGLRVGQRIRVDVPGIGDNGQVGTIKKVLGNRCFVHLEWDERRQHLVVFYAADLEPIETESAPAARG